MNPLIDKHPLLKEFLEVEPKEFYSPYYLHSQKISVIKINGNQNSWELSKYAEQNYFFIYLLRSLEWNNIGTDTASYTGKLYAQCPHFVPEITSVLIPTLEDILGQELDDIWHETYNWPLHDPYTI